MKPFDLKKFITEHKTVINEELSTDQQVADAMVDAIARYVKKDGLGPSDPDLTEAIKIAQLIVQKKYQRAAKRIDNFDAVVREQIPREVFMYLHGKGAAFLYDY
jgi:hypothetical protein